MSMHSRGRYRIGVICVIGLTIALQTVNAELIAHYQMNSPTQLLNNAGAATYQPDFSDPGGANTPTYLSTGGIDGSGAFQFDGTNDYLAFAGVAYLFIGADNTDWTVSFNVTTTDTNANSSYAGTPQVPVMGTDTGGIGFGLGIDGGKAAYRRYSGSWQSAAGSKNVADGLPHFVTFVAVGSSNLSIYMDGKLDASGLSIPGAGFSQLAVHIGRSYSGHYGAFALDDLRVYDEALSAEEVEALFAEPPRGTVITIR